jgi:hypothetical protein
MVCYAVPLAASLLIFGGRKVSHQENEKNFRFGLMMAGGSIFGVVDHLWAGELTMVGPNLASDLALGLAITAVITIAWVAMEALSLAPRSASATV